MNLLSKGAKGVASTTKGAAQGASQGMANTVEGVSSSAAGGASYARDTATRTYEGTVVAGSQMPLEAILSQAKKLASEVVAWVQKLRGEGRLPNGEATTASATTAKDKIYALQGAVLNKENLRTLRDAVVVLLRILDVVQSVQGNDSNSGISAARQGLNVVVQALNKFAAD